MRRTAAAAIAAEPDAVVIIDAPEFTHPIARRIRKTRAADPHHRLRLAQRVGVAARAGRARCARYVDHVLALLPFEPEAHERLGGPPCTYVGHPLIERLAVDRTTLDPAPLAERLRLRARRACPRRAAGQPHLRGRAPDGAVRQGASTCSSERGLGPQVIIPVVPHVRPLIEEHLAVVARAGPTSSRARRTSSAPSSWHTRRWPPPARSRSSSALAGTPMVVAYKVDWLSAAPLRMLIKAPSVVLANLVLGEKAFPEFIQEDCTPEHLASAVELLLRDTFERRGQLAALARIPTRMLREGSSPSEVAAEIVL